MKKMMNIIGWFLEHNKYSVNVGGGLLCVFSMQITVFLFLYESKRHDVNEALIVLNFELSSCQSTGTQWRLARQVPSEKQPGIDYLM